jgi:hypothetical protein
MLRETWKIFQKQFQSTSLEPLDVMENVFIDMDYSLEDICTYTSLFKEFCDVFSWSYEEI